MTIAIRSIGTPQLLARESWARTVRAPCPMSDVPARTITLASAAADDRVGGPRCCRCLDRHRDSPSPSTAERSAPLDPRRGLSYGLRPIAVGRLVAAHDSSPLFARFRSLISSRSIPSPRAASSIWDSMAQDTWGVPKPRNAVAGVVWDNSARTKTRAWGTR